MHGAEKTYARHPCLRRISMAYCVEKPPQLVGWTNQALPFQRSASVNWLPEASM